MFNKTSLFVGVLAVGFGATSLAFAADQNTGTVYMGGHDPARLTRIESRPVTGAPYALTGADKTNTQVRFEAIRIGSRIVGYRPISK
jgi:hypothetical protein